MILSVVQVIQNQISTEDRIWCDQQISMAEIEAAIKGLKKTRVQG